MSGRGHELEACDCGSAQEDNGWACRCTDPPSRRKAESARSRPEILDACCGGRWWWWNRQHPLAIYMDERVVPAGTRPDRPNWSVEPDVVGDFRNMPFADEAFRLVVFDPPHMIQRRITGNVTLQYGILNSETADEDLRRGFAECWRVLTPGGTLVFKWAGPINRVRPHFPTTPIVGTKTARRNGAARGTRWIIFYKPLVAAELEAVA